MKIKSVALLFIMVLCSNMVLAQFAQVNIWEGTSEKKKVSLTPFVCPGKNNPCIIVCPGGSYFWHATKTEGIEVAKWLQSNGISAFVLNYRTAKVPAFLLHTRFIVRGNQYPDPQNDLQRAIEYIKDHAELYGIDTLTVGAMGFSAGGHLVMSVAEIYRSTRSRPSFVVPIYPVVSFAMDCTHKRSRRGLLGEYKKYRKTYRDSLSLERHVPSDCPPVFLVNCLDDPIVDFRNSVLLDSALQAKNINHEYVQYKTGGHGFGVSNKKGTEESRQWKEEFLKWFKSHIVQNTLEE